MPKHVAVDILYIINCVLQSEYVGRYIKFTAQNITANHPAFYTMVISYSESNRPKHEVRNSSNVEVKIECF